MTTSQHLPLSAGEASALDLKIELARRLLCQCQLCARRCLVNRIAGEHGWCGLGSEALVWENFVHIAEEPPINPSAIISLAGCGLHCRFCQQHRLLDVSHVQAVPLPPKRWFWRYLDTAGARSLSFSGGNPDESLYSILRFLSVAPDNWRLPIVWNNHAYCSPHALALLQGVVDVYLPDLKFGDNGCGQRLARAADYPTVAQKAIKTMCTQAVPVIVRILVLPGHAACCHEPSLDFLANLAKAKPSSSGYSEEQPTDSLWISIRGQYAPDGELTKGEEEPSLNCRPAAREVNRVRAHAQALGLNLVT